MQTITIQGYTFDELSKEAKEKALEIMQDINIDYEWYEMTIDEDFKVIGKILGIEIDNVYFNLCCQGAGACFIGRYSYNKGSVKKLIEYAPLDTELHRIAKELQAIQKKNMYRVYANVKHRGNYYHSNCTDVFVERNDSKELKVDSEDAIIQVLRDFMNWMYKRLTEEYMYIVSDEAVIDTIKSNEFLFTEKGERKVYL